MVLGANVPQPVGATRGALLRLASGVPPVVLKVQVTSSAEPTSLPSATVRVMGPAPAPSVRAGGVSQDW